MAFLLGTIFLVVWTGGGAESYQISEGGIAREFVLADGQSAEMATPSESGLRIHQRGVPQSAKTTRWLGRKIRVKLAAGADPQAVALAAGATAFESPHYAPGFVVLTFLDVGDSLRRLEGLRGLPGVDSADPLLAWRKPRRFTPDDPRFAYSAGNTRYQWHLDNTGQNGGITGLDAHVTGVWDTLKGRGVTIGIVDDGLEVAHPDLAANVNTAIDHDWNDATPDDPTPGNTIDDHGTKSAGVAAARGNNRIGISGAAPEATLVGLRLIAGDTTDQEDGEAIAWRTDIIDISNNSWGPDDDGREFHVPEPLISAAFAYGVATGRGCRGTLYVWAGGNGRGAGDYANYDGYNNRIETISVAAVGFDGRQASYSESGANLLVCAPSSSAFGALGITTTTLAGRGSYTDDFGGTSAATPIVSGVLALVLEMNPELGWRDVQEILVRSSRKIDPADSDWSENAAGLHFNHKYGAGMIDAAAAVALADGWVNLGAQQVRMIGSGPLDLPIPDNAEGGVQQTLSFAGGELRLEHVQLTVDIDHSYRGDLEIFLTSPSGTVSQFSERHADSGDHIRNYSFLSVRHWGEAAAGDWSVRIADRRAGNVGVLRSLSLDLYGTAPSGGYTHWAAGEIPVGQDASPGGDPDADGRPNLLEYALGSSPVNPDRLNAPSLSATAFQFDADTGKTDIRYCAESSVDLENWTAVATEVAGVAGTIETRRAAVPAALAGRVFFRLKVRKP